MATQVATQATATATGPSDSTRSSNRGHGRRGRGRGRGGRAAGAQPSSAEQSEDGDGGAQERRGGGEGTGRGRGRGGGRGAGRGGAARGGGSRRARFDAALSTGTATSSHLHATAAPFAPPSAPAIPTPPTPAPVNQTLVERLTTELSSGEAECTVCFDSISRTARIYSCTQCFTPFHLTCISKWATSAVASSAERAQLLASRDTRNPPPPEQLEGHWACPNCNVQFKAKQVPTKYTCFCGRFTDPHPPKGAGATPHSCARPCNRKRPQGCKHPCSLGCHPGPCPPCPVVLNERCHCGSRPLGIRCSALHDGKPPTPTSLAAKEALKSCNQTHNAPLSCGLHSCQRPCHAGECGECEEIREKRCFCGKETNEGICGATRQEDRVEGCVVPGETSDGDVWMGEFSCDAPCGAPYSCGEHRCQARCHPHLNSKPAPCPRSPELIDHCACGKTPLELLRGVAARQKCTDRIPTCGAVCGKVHEECGHVCQRQCHEGECGSCQERVPLICRCGSTKTTRLCGQPYRAPTPPASSSTAENGADDGGVDAFAGVDEFKCNRVCKSMRACGRHQCNRVCCPLAWQEALTTNVKGKGKRRAMSVQDEIAEMEAQDPLGIHRCDRTCGRKLNCGLHNCELRDHKGPCPPCLRADFDELVCNCGATVVLPPIPCNFVIDCRHPCIRPSDCGHPRLPHACHEDPACPPCPYLTAKPCACGKRTVANVRCSMDQRKVSCGIVCGKLLRCGWHRCRKPCHPEGECETVDDQLCLKPRKHCGHPCPLPCHFPSACPADSPCDKLIEVTCSCGHLKQKARCGANDAKPEGNNGRLVKCTDACALAKRNQQLADALGVEKKEAKVREVQHDPLTLNYYAANHKWASEIEAQLVEFVESDKQTLHFPAMKRDQRQFVYELLELFELRGESLDPEPHRSIVVHRTSTSAVPTPNLADALAASKRPSSAMLNLGSLRKTLPERKPNNALYLEGVLGYDEEMLSDILRPHMRGLAFFLTWVTDEDVLVSFDVPSSAFEHDAKLSSIASSLRSVIANTGFCVGVESVLLSDDGRVVRGGWTPVGGASASMSASSSTGSNPRDFKPLAGIRTGNAFASLGSSPPKAPQPVRNAWGAGSVIGAAHSKPPRAVVAPQGEQERFLHSPLASAPSSRVPTPSLPPPPPVAKKQEDVPDEWDADVEGEAQEE